MTPITKVIIPKKNERKAMNVVVHGEIKRTPQLEKAIATVIMQVETNEKRTGKNSKKIQ